MLLGLHEKLQGGNPILLSTERKESSLPENNHASSDFWKNVIFSGEFNFNIFTINGRMIVWRGKGDALNTKYTTKNVKHGERGVMVWVSVHQIQVQEI